MRNESEVFLEDNAWSVLRKHFVERDGLLDQIDQGRNIQVRLWNEPEQCVELQEIQKALEIVHNSWGSKHALPKWQIRLFWSVAPRVEEMIQRHPAQALTLHILHAKLFTWFGNALNELSREYYPEDLIIHDIAVHTRELKGFGTELRFGKVDVEAFEELVQAVTILRTIWKGQLEIPRMAAWLFILVPIMSWGASVYTGEQRKQLAGMKRRLYVLVEDCLCD